MKKTILIFGISSFVGSNLAELLRDEYRIIGTYHANAVSIPGITCLPCDVLKKDYVLNVIAIFKPDYTIYSVGMSNLSECHMDPKKADALNSLGAVNCSMASERYGSKFIYLSSGFVLGGGNILHNEEDTPFPMSVYGSSLLSSEFYIQRSCLNYLILRCAPIFGRSINPTRPTWFEHLQTNLAKKNPFVIDNFIETGFIDVYTLADTIKKILKVITENSLIHVSSTDSMTRFEFAKIYAKIFDKDSTLLQSGAGNFPVDNSKRSSESTDGNYHYFKLDTTVAENLVQTKMPKIEEMIRITFDRLAR